MASHPLHEQRTGRSSAHAWSVLFWGLKGGNGKSTLSVLYALETGVSIVTNDVYSPVDKALPPGHCTKLAPQQSLSDLPPSGKVAFDFGGYADHRILEAIQRSRVVVIPIINSYADIQVAINTIQEVARYTKKILVVVNRAKPGDLEEVRTVIHGTVGKYPLLPLKTSKVLARIYKRPQPISQLVAESRLNGYLYGELHQQVTAIINKIAAIANA